MSGRKRNNVIKIHLTDNELKQLNEDCKTCGLARENYLRMLMGKVVPRAAPSKELIETVSQLRHIGNNMNQISYVANCSNKIDAQSYQKCYNDLTDEIKTIMEIITRVEKVKI